MQLFIKCSHGGWEPEFAKRYLNDALTAGHSKLYASDERTHADNSQKYGSAGLLLGKKYMLSVTWNALLQAFNDKNNFVKVQQ